MNNEIKETIKSTKATSTIQKENGKQNAKDYSRSNKRKRGYLSGSKGISKPKQDPEFYASKENMANIASFNWSSALGDLIALNSTDTACAAYTPGIMKVSFLPSLGNTGPLQINATAYPTMLSKCADAYFNSFVQGFTGSVPFESADLFTLMLAATSIFDWLIIGKRVYALHNSASIYNRYWPQQVIRSMGWDYDDFVANLADFRARFNTYVDKINEWIKVPTKFKIADRWEYLCSNVFTDYDDLDKSQLYYYYPKYLFKYDPDVTNFGSALVYEEVPTGLTVDGYFEFLDKLLVQLRTQDSNNIFGALMRVFDKSDFKVATHVTEDTTLHLAHDTLYLEQLHNAVPAEYTGTLIEPGILANDFSPNSGYRLAPIALYQNQNGVLFSRPATRDTSIPDLAIDTYLVDVLKKGYPGPETFIDITANTMPVMGRLDGVPYVNSDGENSTMSACFMYPRCEIIDNVQIFVCDSETQEGYYSGQVDYRITDPDWLAYPANLWVRTFNYAPIIYGFFNSRFHILSEIANFGTIQLGTLRKCHELTFSELLALPVYSKSVTK